MAVIEPDDAQSSTFLSNLAELDQILRTRSTRIYLDRLIDEEFNQEDNESVRRLQAGRYEIFVEAKSKISRAFDHLTRDLTFSKCDVISYVQKQILRDKRLSQKNDHSSKGGYELGNISIILNFEAAPAQAPHIDMTLPNYQCALLISDCTPGTLFSETTQPITNVDDLARHWSDNGHQMPHDLRGALENDDLVRNLLNKFGKLLHTTLTLVSPGKTLKRGTLITLPGSVVHAGPSSTTFRSVLFASMWPKGSTEPRYDPDTQYSSIILCSHLLSLVWSNIGLTERIYILERTVSYIKDKGLQDMSNHFPNGPLSAFLEVVALGKYPANMTLEGLILKSARNDAFAICEPCKHPPPDNSRRMKAKFDHLKCLSVTNDLSASFDGKWYKVLLYRRPNSKYVLMYYPEDNTWEGNKPDDRYTLTLNTSDELFDGSNGVVRGSDGAEIQFKQPRIPRKKARL